ncbi:MAG: hypothetical protein ACSHW7_07550 [Patiriisocius sp.]|uniref:hypothetical protein n=1 Tax=Patiriisocius sp. TaxID=2822396 RepID=UPI003EF4B615
MKFIIIILLALTTAKSCDTTKIEAVTYEASTRGFYKKIVATQDALIISNTRNEKDNIQNPMAASTWETINTKIREIELKKMESLQRPSTDSYFDGAASATLNIATKENDYTSTPFDAGNPPEELKQLIVYLELLAKD